MTATPVALDVAGRRVVFSDRLCWAILFSAIALGAALILYLNRGTTFYVDELNLFYRSPSLDSLADILQPQNGHLIAVPRLEFKLILETLGSGYLPFRLLALAALLACVVQFYALIKPRIGALPALAPAILLLLLGSDSQHIVIPVGFMILFSTAMGLGALLALEREGRRWDLLACGLLAVSILTFATGLVFAAGIGISVLLRDDRWRRVWVFAVPLAMYAAWWVWALDVQSSSDEQVHLSNALLIPSYAFESLAAVMAAITGINYDFGEINPRVLELEAGAPLALVAIGALAFRVRRGGVPPLVWVGLTLVLAYWALGALVVSDLRPPGLIRYLFFGTLGVMLTAAAAVQGMRWSRFRLAVLFVVAALALVTNVALLRDGAAGFRAQSAEQRAEFTAFELARGEIDAAYDPDVLRPELAPDAFRAGAYFAAADRYGSPAFSVEEIDDQPNPAREALDRSLAGFLGLGFEPREAQREHCREHRPDSPGSPVGFELPHGGAVLIASSGSAAPLTLGRFGDNATAEIGSLDPEEPAALEIPEDDASAPWRTSVSGAEAVLVCPLR